jgi:hypothetical protein
VSKPWKKKPKRDEIKRQLSHLEKTSGVSAACFKCQNPGLAMDECLTCERLGRSKFRVFSCADHRQDGLRAVKKHALIKHPANLLRAIAAGLRGEEI